MAVITLGVVAAAVFAPLLYYCLKVWSWYQNVKPKVILLQKHIGGPKKHWLFGTLNQFQGFDEEGFKFFRNNAEQHKYAWLFWVTPFVPNVELVHPDSAKELFKSTEPKQMGFMGAYRLLTPWIGDSLITSSGEKWKRNRRLLTPAFHFDVLRSYIDVYNESVSKFIDKMNHECSKDTYTEVFSPVSLMTLNVILHCAFSYSDDIQAHGINHPYVQAVRRLTDLTISRIFFPPLLFDTLYYLLPMGREETKHVKFVHSISEEIIEKRKEKLKINKEEINNKKSKDFLDILLLARDEDGSSLSHKEIMDEVNTFMFAGHDTTASAISWILQTFADHQEHQKLAQDEVDALLKDRESEDIVWDDLQNIPYLTKCIKEGIRLHTPVPIIGRTTTKELKFGDVTIPADMNVEISLYDIHHNPHVWGNDHMEFKPERFDHENISKMDSYSFVPFSAGSRNCIGQSFAMNEIKVAVSRVLRRFNIEADPKRPAKHILDAVMRAENGMYLKFTERHMT